MKSAMRTGEFLNLKKNDKALLCLPVSFIAGKMMVVRAFVLGLDLITIKPSSKPLEDLNTDIDFAAMTPMQVFYAMQSPQGFEQLQKIKKLIIGGGPVDHSLLLQIRKLTSEVWHTYGMAETLTHVALKKLNGASPDDHFMALNETTFRQDDRGCLVIKAPWLNKNEIVTNDLVDLIDDKTFDFIGRIDNIINSGGIKISPETVESKLQNYLDSRFIITGLPDKVLGQKIVLIIEGKTQPSEKISKLLDRANLGKYEHPKEIRFMYHFPQTESGKILRRQITAHFSNQNII